MNHALVLVAIHVMMNILILLFAFLDGRLPLRKRNCVGIQKVTRVVAGGLAVMGFLTYLIYIVLTIQYVHQDGLDKQSLGLLILGWGFLYAAYLTVQCGIIKQDKELPYE